MILWEYWEGVSMLAQRKKTCFWLLRWENRSCTQSNYMRMDQTWVVFHYFTWKRASNAHISLQLRLCACAVPKDRIFKNEKILSVFDNISGCLADRCRVSLARMFSLPVNKLAYPMVETRDDPPIWSIISIACCCSWVRVFMPCLSLIPWWIMASDTNIICRWACACTQS